VTEELVFKCYSCNDRDGASPMLLPQLWREVVRQGERLLCISCIESRLGRELRLDDLTRCHWNDNFRVLFERIERLREDSAQTVSGAGS
jgi:hypothetical protein